MQHDLLHSDFRLAPTFKALHDENEVQNWIADRLRLQQGNAYSVDREPRRAQERMPDIVARAKASDANVAIEIKVVEDWSTTQLLDALNLQLCGRYLRASGGRHGILLPGS